MNALHPGIRCSARTPGTETWRVVIPGAIHTAAWSPDDARVAAATVLGTLVVVDGSRGAAL